MLCEILPKCFRIRYIWHIKPITSYKHHMKKTFLLLAFFALNLAALAQQEIEFKVEFKPQSTYTQVMDMDMNMSAKGDDGSKKMDQPMKMALIYAIKTARASKGGDVPFTADMKVESAMIPKDTKLDDTKIYGKFVNNVPVVDSMHVQGMPMAQEKLKQSFSKTLSMFSNEPIKLKVGESVKINKMPMDLGALQMGNDTDISITFTLKSVTGNKAFFDVFMDTPLDMAVQGMNVKGSMKMTGQMTYITDLKYVPEFLIDIDALFSMKRGDEGITLQMAGKMKVNTTLKAN